MGELVSFPVLFAGGLWRRKQPEAHKQVLAEAPVGGFMPAAVAPWVGHHSWAVPVQKRECAGWRVVCRSRDVDDFSKAGRMLPLPAGFAPCGTVGEFGWMAADSMLAFRWA